MLTPKAFSAARTFQSAQKFRWVVDNRFANPDAIGRHRLKVMPAALYLSFLQIGGPWLTPTYMSIEFYYIIPNFGLSQITVFTADAATGTFSFLVDSTMEGVIVRLFDSYGYINGINVVSPTGR